MRSLGAILLLGLMVLVIQLGRADQLVDSDPGRALQIWSGHRQAAEVWLHRQRGEEGVAVDPRVDEVARSVLAESPLQGEMYRALAEQALGRGEAAQALALFRLASLRAPRDKLAHIWLVQTLAAQGEHAEALAHIDQLFRQAPRQGHFWSQALFAYANQPQGQAALVAMLGGQNPPWRETFIQRWVSHPEAEPHLANVLVPLREARFPLTAAERAAWMGRLISLKRTAEAYFVWVEGLNEAQRAVSANVHDGGFELPADNAGFGWHWQRVAGAIIGAEYTKGAIGERALYIDFLYRRVAFQHIRQALMLTPARYRLSGRARMDKLDNASGLLWEVLCDRNQSIAQTEGFRGSHGWKAFSVEFDLPAEGCTQPWLRLRLDARVPAERWIGGRAWFDHLAIERIAP